MLIRQPAFTGTTRLLKGALHCHTTRSDGAGTPEAVIRLHKAHGYDFMALTDHRKYNYRNFAPDVDMTILPGMEMDRSLGADNLAGHCFHAVVLGVEQKDGNPFAQDQTFESGRVAGQDEFQALLDEMHEAGQMTMYCHPEWSRTGARYYDRMRGNFAMELWNSGCAMENNMDRDNGMAWDELLMQGQRIFGTAVDDGHGMDTHCNGWVRVNSANTIPDILAALKDGAFYSSCGPEIHDFYVEDGKAVIECSPCQRIVFCYGHNPNRMFKGAPELARAELALGDSHRYIRAYVVDAQGRYAWTNPIFLK